MYLDSTSLANKRKVVNRSAWMNDTFQLDQKERKKKRKTASQAIMTLDLFLRMTMNFEVSSMTIILWQKYNIY